MTKISKNIKDILVQSGFSPKQASVYFALLSEEFLTVTAVANKSGLKRSIVYVILEELVSKGYVMQVPRTRIKKYQAVNPEVVLTKLKFATSSFASMMPYFAGLHEQHSGKPKIRFIDNVEEIKQMYFESNLHKEVFAISSFEEIDRVFPGIVDEWLAAFDGGVFPLNNFRQIIFHPDNKINHYASQEKMLVERGVQIRSLSVGEHATKIDVLFYGDSVALTSFGENPHAIVIQSPMLHEGLKAFFEILWGVARE